MTVSSATPRSGGGSRCALLCAALALALLLAAAPAMARPGRPQDGPRRGGPGPPSPVAAENARPGDRDWLTAEPQPSARIEGYTGATSVLPGETLTFHVSTLPAASYRIDIYRLGYYRGDGARRVACLPACDATSAGAPRPVPTPDPLTGRIDAAWPVTDAIAVPADWLSGYYAARLTLTDGDQAGRGSYVPFIVRAPDARRTPVIVQAAVNTWEAYNAWGGASMYEWAGGPLTAATHVSFSRPFDAAHTGTAGFLGPFSFDYPLVRFLEKQGLDASYTTDRDIDADPAELLRHRLVIVPGHSEYWTAAMRAGFQAARDAGTNLFFAGANTAYWRVRYEADGSGLIAYKDTADPATDPAWTTGRFRDLTPPQPECELVGTSYSGTWPEDPSGGANRAPRPYAATAAAADDPWFAGTGFTPGATVPAAVWYEWDVYDPACRPGATVLFHYEGSPSNADAVRYTAASGARVFSAGSLGFAGSLASFLTAGPQDDARLGRFMRNGLDDLLRPAAPLAVDAGRSGSRTLLTVTLGKDPRVRRVVVLRHAGPGAFAPRDAVRVCGPGGVRHPAGTFRYAAVAIDGATRSAPAFSAPVREAAADGRGSTQIRIQGPAGVRRRSC